MAGIYIHIPFCKKACHYCNFHFSTATLNIDELIEAIVQEIGLQKKYLTSQIETIYFGGGTPSLIGVANIEKILIAIQQIFDTSAVKECTLEANPDDINTAQIIAWKNLGINRLSIGIQSFVDADLQWMNRAHNATQATNCIKTAKENGIENLSIDLIYGTPNLSNVDWLQNIETAMQLGIQHLSCYALTVEPNTALEKMIAQKKKVAVDPNKAAEQMELLMQLAPNYKLEHYEISNLALSGYRSKHNSNYWSGAYYLGVGPSAHSYNGCIRQWNVANNALYIKSLAQQTIPFEVELLTEKDKQNEYIMTSLRTMEGLDLSKVDVLAKAKKYIVTNLMFVENGFLKLTHKGKLRADGIASALFV